MLSRLETYPGAIDGGVNGELKLTCDNIDDDVIPAL
jgi:hypothetical protein